MSTSYARLAEKPGRSRDEAFAAWAALTPQDVDATTMRLLEGNLTDVRRGMRSASRRTAHILKTLQATNICTRESDSKSPRSTTIAAP